MRVEKESKTIVLAAIVIAFVFSAGLLTISLGGRFGQAITEYPLVLTVQLSKDTYLLGETLNVRFDLKNIAKESIILVFSDAQTFDFLIKDVNGEIIHQWSWDWVFAQMVMEKPLYPGQSIQQILSWTLSVSGQLTLIGYAVPFSVSGWTGITFNLTAEPIAFEVHG